MKLRYIRRFYSHIDETSKNIKWRHLTDTELDKSMHQPQIVANCYDEATRYALLNSVQGRAMLKRRIWIENTKSSTCPAYKILFNINGKEKAYRATFKDYWGSFNALTERYWINDHNNYARLSLGVNVAMAKMIKEFPFMKPFISKLYVLEDTSEFNKPSNAFKLFTGKSPLIIGESNFNINLLPYKEKVLELLTRLSQKNKKDYSFVAMTGAFPIRPKKLDNAKVSEKISSWHCLAIVRVCKNKQIYLKNPREKGLAKMSFDDFIKRFKGIIGLEYD